VHRSPRWAVQRAFSGAADMSPRRATNIKLIPAHGDEAASGGLPVRGEEHAVAPQAGEREGHAWPRLDQRPELGIAALPEAIELAAELGVERHGRVNHACTRLWEQRDRVRRSTQSPT